MSRAKIQDFGLQLGEPPRTWEVDFLFYCIYWDSPDSGEDARLLHIKRLVAETGLGPITMSPPSAPLSNVCRRCVSSYQARGSHVSLFLEHSDLQPLWILYGDVLHVLDLRGASLASPFLFSCLLSMIFVICVTYDDLLSLSVAHIPYYRALGKLGCQLLRLLLLVSSLLAPRLVFNRSSSCRPPSPTVSHHLPPPPKEVTSLFVLPLPFCPLAPGVLRSNSFLPSSWRKDTIHYLYTRAASRAQARSTPPGQPDSTEGPRRPNLRILRGIGHGLAILFFFPFQ